MASVTKPMWGTRIVDGNTAQNGIASGFRCFFFNHAHKRDQLLGRKHGDYAGLGLKVSQRMARKTGTENTPALA